jgi:hypothetical protein
VLESRICPNCQRQVFGAGKRCPNCGDQPQPANAEAKTVLLRPSASMASVEAPTRPSRPSQPHPPPLPPNLPAAAGQWRIEPVTIAGPGPVRSLRRLLVVSGLIFVACLLVPWSWTSPVVFSWDAISASGSLSTKALPLVLAAGSLLALFTGVLPVAKSGRAAASLVIGAASLLAVTINSDTILVTIEPSWWRVAVDAIGIAAASTGLLLRWYHPALVPARLLCTIGCVALLATHLIPIGGETPLVLTWRALGHGGAARALAIVHAAIFVLALASLVAWWPAPRKAGTLVLAWIAIALPIAVSIVLWVPDAHRFDALLASPVDTLLAPIAATTWWAMLAYGAAALVARPRR